MSDEGQVMQQRIFCQQSPCEAPNPSRRRAGWLWRIAAQDSRMLQRRVRQPSRSRYSSSELQTHLRELGAKSRHGHPARSPTDPAWRQPSRKVERNITCRSWRRWQAWACGTQHHVWHATSRLGTQHHFPASTKPGTPPTTTVTMRSGCSLRAKAALMSARVTLSTCCVQVSR